MSDKLELKTGKDKTLRALQLIQLEGLKEIDRICRKYDIKYSLGGGTCLGQLRHGGFIPWDDDIDVDMTRDNFKKFMEVAPLELDANKYFLRCRQTDKKYLRTCSRLEMKYTSLGLKKWDKRKMHVGIFVDIFQWSYLPNNKFLRRIVASSLFYIRCIENYKAFHQYARKANRRHAALVVILSKLLSKKMLFKLEDMLTGCCGNKKTDWIMDDAIINGNTGGYPSDGVDEYTDVDFEGLRIMNKKNPHNFMKTIYGEHYMEWLPPAARISHHEWTKMNFGIYKNRFELPDHYGYYLTSKYSKEKLEKMQEVSMDILNDIDNICKKRGIKYFVSGLNSYAGLCGVEEYCQYFREPIKIAMPRDSYNKFAEAIKQLDKKYFYQTSETDPNYKASYGLLRLKYTYFRDALIPKRLEDKYIDAGFFVKIIPLDNASNDAKERRKQLKHIRYLNHFINLKWKNYNLKYFKKKSLKMKLKMIALFPLSIKFLMKKLNKWQNKYNDTETSYYVDASGYQLEYRYIDKTILGKGKRINYLGHRFVFAENKDMYLEYVGTTYSKKKIKRLQSLAYIKENFNDSYLKMCNISKKYMSHIQKRYPLCSLTYYDLEDYQLSVLRYDEQSKKYLTNEEILNYQK